MEKLAETAPERWFTQGFIAREPAVVAEMQEVLAKLDAEGYAACCDALGQSDLRSEISEIVIPTLVLTGDADPRSEERRVGKECRYQWSRTRYKKKVHE